MIGWFIYFIIFRQQKLQSAVIWEGFVNNRRARPDNKLLFTWPHSGAVYPCVLTLRALGFCAKNWSDAKKYFPVFARKLLPVFKRLAYNLSNIRRSWVIWSHLEPERTFQTQGRGRSHFMGNPLSHILYLCHRREKKVFSRQMWPRGKQELQQI